MFETPVFKWRVIGASVRGASHLRSQLPCQDAMLYSVGPAGSTPVILAVADGHGSPKCFRSDTGAKLAVSIAAKIVIPRFLKGMQNQPLSAIKNAAEKLLPADLAKTWRDFVNTHFAAHPFSADELEKVAKEVGPEARILLSTTGQHRLAYGTTLLIAVVTESFIFYLQLGDGDILTVSDRTGKVEYPIVHDAALMANETTSMCEDNAQRLFRFRFQHVQDSAPALILVSTDGYSNSFKSDEAFNKVGTDFLDILRRDGADTVQSTLKSWLNEASDSGSGDDVTLGVICRLDAISGGPDRSAESDSSNGAANQDPPVSVAEPAGIDGPLPSATPSPLATDTPTGLQAGWKTDSLQPMTLVDQEVEAIVEAFLSSSPLPDEGIIAPAVATEPVVAALDSVAISAAHGAEQTEASSNSADGGRSSRWWGRLCWFKKARTPIQ